MTTQRSVGTFVGGTLLIGFGVLALFGQVFRNFHFWSYVWPFAVIGAGLMFFIGMFAGGKSLAALAIPGSIITANGLMLFFQNITGHWSTWSYGWTITLASVGLGIFIMGSYQGDEHRRQAGLKVMKIAAVLFVLFGAFFEMVLSPFGLAAGRYTFPVLLILLGGYLVVSRSGLLGGRNSEDESVSEISS
jgi:hypothetical protein